MDITLTDLCISVGSGRQNRTLLSPTSLVMPGGKVTCILGASGSGKSTLLKVLAALVPPTEGTAYIGDTDVRDLDPRGRLHLRRVQVSLVYQQYNLFDTLTGLENAALGLELRGVSTREAQESAGDWLETLGLVDVANDFPETMSGGEQQRIAIARALTAGSPVLLADEPTGALDARSADIVVGAIRDAASHGMCCVVVTHNEKVASQADDVLFLEEGTLTS